MLSFREYITELVHIGNKKPSVGDYVVVYRKWMWILNNKNFDSLADDMFRAFGWDELVERIDNVRDLPGIGNYVDSGMMSVLKDGTPPRVSVLGRRPPLPTGGGGLAFCGAY